MNARSLAPGMGDHASSQGIPSGPAMSFSVDVSDPTRSRTSGSAADSCEAARTAESTTVPLTPTTSDAALTCE